MNDSISQLLSDEFASVCQDLDVSKIQDSWSWRNTHVARQLAILLIDDKGEIEKKTLQHAVKVLSQKMYSLEPDRYHDGSRQQHLLKILKLFYENPDYGLALRRIYAPVSHPGLDRLIKETLYLPENMRINDAYARRAAFSALLTTLRQNVGSCFATAPAILIQQEQPLNFLADIAQLIATGRLTRVFGGVEYAVPLSLSWGIGDLFRPILFHTLGKQPLATLSFSLGLQAAFEAAGLLEKNMGRKAKQEACFALLHATKNVNQENDVFAYVTAEQLIKEVLQHAFSVADQEVHEFQVRPFRGHLSELVIQAPLVGKGAAVSHYLKAYAAAKGAFKALTDNALLKAWEFTLASLSESKADFAKWNLYISLGVSPEEPNGIGSSLYTLLQNKINSINEELEEAQSRFDHLFAQAKYLEGRLTHLSSESEMGWARAEYQMRRHEINRALSERDAIYEKGRKLQNLYPSLIEFYGKKIRDYFQEVYDAEMHDISASPYDDSPAGFRLMYKHGRSNTALWTLIHSAEEYIQHLTSFFISTEVELNQLTQFEGLQKEIGEIVTALIMTIKNPDFLESSFYRLAKAYNEPIVKNPLTNLEKVTRKPWVYISGGTMTTLTSCYWGSEQKPKETKQWVESENELLAFLIDTLKECPLSVQRKYQDDATASMLAFSPTHAFLCKPGFTLFRKAWESDIYTYTWIRDHWAAPQRRFLDTILLNARMVEVIIQELLLSIPQGYHPIVKKALQSISHAMTSPEFREHVLKILSYEKWLQGEQKLTLLAEELDSILYRFLPLFPEHELEAKLTTLFEEIGESGIKLFENVGKYQILTAEDLRNIAKRLLILNLKETRSPIFYHQKITEAMQKTGLCYPEPLIFADTNWVKNVFGFIVNPGTRELEFWRFDECGSSGRPIAQWKRYLNGTDKQDWGLYTRPHEYGQ